MHAFIRFVRSLPIAAFLLPFFLNTGRAAPEKGDDLATGFIHVKQIDGVWWFINADGERFVSVG